MKVAGQGGNRGGNSGSTSKTSSSSKFDSFHDLYSNRQYLSIDQSLFYSVLRLSNALIDYDDKYLLYQIFLGSRRQSLSPRKKGNKSVETSRPSSNMSNRKVRFFTI